MESRPSAPAPTAAKQEKKEGPAITEKTLSLIAERCGINGPLVIVERTAKGHIGESMIVASNEDRYFLKGSRNRSAERTRQIHAVEDFMHTEGIPAVAALGPSGDKDVSDPEISWSLYPYVDGKHYEPTTFTPAAIASAGDMLAQIHEKTAGKDKPFDMPWAPEPINPENFKRDAEEVIAFVNARQTQDDFDREILKSFELKFSLMDRLTEPTHIEQFPSAINHGDFQHENFFFDDNDKVAWLIDWELASWRPRIAEVARALVYMCFDSDFTEEGFERARHFLSAYNQKQPFSKEELLAGFRRQLQGQLTATWIPRIHYRGNNRVDEFLPRETRSIRYLSEHMEELVEKLYSSVEVK